MTFLKIFFAPDDPVNFPPCGMFTKGHFLAMGISFLLVAIAFLLTRKIKESSFQKMKKVFAILLVVLEVIKITYKFVYGYTNVDSWVPLSYCSIFIYVMIIEAFVKNPFLLKCADAFILGGCFIAGVAFILIPSTSLMTHPILHYLSIHSMFFHSSMIYMALMYWYRFGSSVKIQNYKYYLFILWIFLILCFILNLIFDSNLMLIMSPYNIPIGFINSMYAAWRWFYTIFDMVGYSLMYLMILGPKLLIQLICKWYKFKKV